jgi:hypothetical protein
MYEILIMQNIKFRVFYITMKIQIIFIWICLNIFVMCLLHITLLQFQIFIKKHLALHYMICCFKITKKVVWDNIF